MSLRISHLPRSSLPLQNPISGRTVNRTFRYRCTRILSNSFKSTTRLQTKAVLSEVSDQTRYPRIGAKTTGTISPAHLLEVVELAAKTGAEVRNFITDKASEAAILEVVKKNFSDHLILGEEGGIIGDSSSDYLWCIDPLDGTTNFAHGYPSFAVSVGVLYRGNPAAASVVEFVGGPMCWNTRTFSATAGGGALCNGQKIHVSKTDAVERALLITGFGYEHDDAWSTNMELFKEFTDVSRGVRRLGAAAVDMCHVALGIAESYWEYRLKPWDMAAGVLSLIHVRKWTQIVEEAGGAVTRMDGGKFSVFDRSVLVSNGVLHPKLLERIAPATENLKSKGIDFSLWFKPEDYHTEL
ncbi:Contains similarity to gi/1653332 extragenic suppressor (SuhB) from Synechocystis sp. gb/D90912 and is a member of the Inositol monophophatase family PF/00459. EST gb/AA597395 comes from this gene [Arabidopsis thaliana]|nr:Contains similarity to gi/1653332 extragenic suppressor (SuhB) from Synechocystis sp. gb/D90912 and is a member of the Inositol monophophatase family PF/00459. EST gb/AA597395 comes from this gene [Arabidopsis thaliana]